MHNTNELINLNFIGRSNIQTCIRNEKKLIAELEAQIDAAETAAQQEESQLSALNARWGVIRDFFFSSAPLNPQIHRGDHLPRQTRNIQLLAYNVLYLIISYLLLIYFLRRLWRSFSPVKNENRITRARRNQRDAIAKALLPSQHEVVLRRNILLIYAKNWGIFTVFFLLPAIYTIHSVHSTPEQMINNDGNIDGSWSFYGFMHNFIKEKIFIDSGLHSLYEAVRSLLFVYIAGTFLCEVGNQWLLASHGGREIEKNKGVFNMMKVLLFGRSQKKRSPYLPERVISLTLERAILLTAAEMSLLSQQPEGAENDHIQGGNDATKTALKAGLQHLRATRVQNHPATTGERLTTLLLFACRPHRNASRNSLRMVSSTSNSPARLTQDL